AVGALELDDLVISIDGPEPPIMDGSSLPFLEALREAGAREQPGCVQFARLIAPVRLEDGESVYEATPAEHLELDVTIEFPHPVIGRQEFAGRISARAL